MNKLKIGTNEFELEDNLYDKPNVLGIMQTFRGKVRETISIRTKMSYEEMKLFVKENMEWGIQIDENYYDNSSYSMVCFTGEFEDGSTLFIMGKKTDDELQAEMINDILGV